MEAKFEQIDAVVAQQEAQMAMTELDKGLIDKATYYKVRRYEDPSTIQKGLMRDMIYRDPDVIEQGVINAFREEGFGELADRRQAELDIRKMQRLGEAINATGPEDEVPEGGPMGGPTASPDMVPPDAIIRQRGPTPQPPVPVGPEGGMYG